MTTYELCLTFTLADRKIRTVVARSLSSQNLTMMQWLLLGALKKASSKGFSMSQIASKLGVTLPQVTALLSDLTEQQLVKLKTQSNDKRSRHAIITANGEKVLEAASKNIDENLSNLLTPEKLVEYENLLVEISGINPQRVAEG